MTKDKKITMNTLSEQHSTTIRVSFLILLSGTILFLMVYGRSIFIPVAIAFFIWFLINGIAHSIQGISVGGRQLPSRLSMFFTIFIMAFLMIQLVGLVVNTAMDLVAEGEVYQANIAKLLVNIPPVIRNLVPGLGQEELSASADQLFLRVFENFSSYISTLVANFIFILGQIVIMFIYVIFLLLEQSTFVTKIRNIFPDTKQRDNVNSVLNSVKTQTQRYISMKTAVSLITAVPSYLVMVFFEVDYAVVWAVLIFLLNFIPYIGSLIAVMFPILLCLLQTGDWSLGLMLLLSLTAIQCLVGYIIEPMIMGRSLGISPVAVLVSLSLFGTIWAIPGMFLSVPIVIILMIVLSHFESTKFISILLSEDGQLYNEDLIVEV
ncbi:MAG: AI-2E family transporter [Chloroflexota bacterium]